MRIRKQIVFDWLLLTALALGISVWLVIHTPFLRVDHFLFDTFSPLLAHPPAEEVIIVGMDDKSLEALGPWPWNRQLHAQLLTQLKGYKPKAIVFDILFMDSIPESDAIFQTAIQESVPVFLPLSIETIGDQQLKIEYPTEPLKSAATGLGHIYVEVGPDSSARDVYLWQGVNKVTFPHISLAVCRHLSTSCQIRYPQPTPEKTLADGTIGFKSVFNYQMIPFAGPPGYFPHASYIDVLRGNVEPELLKDKVIFIGTVTHGIGDYFTTPVSQHFLPMSGVEILANIYDMLHQPRILHPLSPAHALIISLLIVVISMIALLLLGPKSNSLLLLCYLGSVLFLSIGLLKFYWIWFSPMNLWVTMLIIFPFWHWRRLEALQKDLDDRVQQLLDIPLLLDPYPYKTEPTPQPINPIQDRIERLRVIADRLRNAQALVRYALEGFPGSVLITNSSWQIVLMNRQALTLIDDATPLYDMPLLEFLENIGIPERSDLTSIFNQVTHQHQTIAFQIKGSEKSYLVSLAPCHQPDSPVCGLVVCVLDITLWQQAKEKREEFMRFLSHDIRSPLSSIVMSLDESMLPKHLNTETHLLLQKVRQYATRSLKLAENFLHLAKAESIDPDKFVEVELFDVIEIAIDDLWPQAHATNIVIDIEDTTSTQQQAGAWVVGERDLLIRMLINLITNALKYSPPYRKITIRLERKETFWIIRVIDQGRGIEREKLDQIFGKFERIKHSKEYYQEGIGLGLVIVKTIIDRHHGQIKVDSKVGQGTCFSVYLPAISSPFIPLEED